MEDVFTFTGIPVILITFIFSILLVIVDSFTKKESNLNRWLATFALIVMFVTSMLNIANISVLDFNFITNSVAKINNEMLNIYNSNRTAHIFDAIFCLAALLSILPTKEYFSKVYTHHKEYYSLLFFSLLGMMVIAHANNLVTLFLGIETMSIPFYALTGFLRKRESAIEGALKYFLLGAFSSGFLLYGITMIYGATGTMSYDEISVTITNMQADALYLKLGIGLVIVGLLFKIAIFPFHQWAPDVYQAAATPLSGFMSTSGKIAAIAGLMGIVSVTFFSNSTSHEIILKNSTIQLILSVTAAITMLTGNITALAQKNIKRMLAYSSVGHAGYMLMGIVAINSTGISGILYYSIAYCLTQIGAFTVISILETKKEKMLELSDWTGISKQYPILSAGMAIFMFSLAGIPPFAGFFGKYFLFKATIEAGFTWLTIIAVITSVIAVYFYLSVIVQMYFKTNENILTLEKHNISKLGVIITSIAVIVVGVLPVFEFIKY